MPPVTNDGYRNAEWDKRDHVINQVSESDISQALPVAQIQPDRMPQLQVRGLQMTPDGVHTPSSGVSEGLLQRILKNNQPDQNYKIYEKADRGKDTKAARELPFFHSCHNVFLYYPYFLLRLLLRLHSSSQASLPDPLRSDCR